MNNEDQPNYKDLIDIVLRYKNPFTDRTHYNHDQTNSLESFFFKLRNDNERAFMVLEDLKNKDLLKILEHVADESERSIQADVGQLENITDEAPHPVKLRWDDETATCNLRLSNTDEMEDAYRYAEIGHILFRYSDPFDDCTVYDHSNKGLLYFMFDVKDDPESQIFFSSSTKPLEGLNLPDNNANLSLSANVNDLKNLPSNEVMIKHNDVAKSFLVKQSTPEELIMYHDMMNLLFSLRNRTLEAQEVQDFIMKYDDILNGYGTKLVTAGRETTLPECFDAKFLSLLRADLDRWAEKYSPKEASPQKDSPKKRKKRRGNVTVGKYDFSEIFARMSWNPVDIKRKTSHLDLHAYYVVNGLLHTSMKAMCSICTYIRELEGNIDIAKKDLETLEESDNLEISHADGLSRDDLISRLNKIVKINTIAMQIIIDKIDTVENGCALYDINNNDVKNINPSGFIANYQVREGEEIGVEIWPREKKYTFSLDDPIDCATFGSRALGGIKTRKGRGGKTYCPYSYEDFDPSDTKRFPLRIDSKGHNEFIRKTEKAFKIYMIPVSADPDIALPESYDNRIGQIVDIHAANTSKYEIAEDTDDADDDEENPGIIIGCYLDIESRRFFTTAQNLENFLDYLAPLLKFKGIREIFKNIIKAEKADVNLEAWIQEFE